MNLPNDPQIIAVRGDCLERQWSDRILNGVPSYATFWANYIGNDGYQNPLHMLGADKAAHEKRDLLWPYLYTLFESLALAWELESQFRTRAQITCYAEYAANLNAWIAFYAHLGRIHDMAKEAAEMLEQDALFNPLKGFYDKRNIVLHGIKVPMQWADKFLCAPSVGEGQTQWHDHRSWTELKKVDFDFICDRVARDIGDLECLLESFLTQVLGIATAKYGLKPIKWFQPTVNPVLVEVAMAATQSCSPLGVFGSGTSGIHNMPPNEPGTD